MRRAQVYIYGVLCLILLLCAGVIFNAAAAPEPQEVEADREYILSDTVVKREVYYRACRHLVSERVSNSAEFNNKSFSELIAQGWYAFWGQNGEACVFAEHEGLCPEDEGKYHLILQDGRLVIVHGPKGYNGEVEGRIRVSVEKLPQRWQDMLAADGIEFADREELMTALESLDEL